MAVRPQHMHVGGIIERRLRPIYDWLDNGNNKKALQEAEKVLKKSPTLQSARALKAVALYRLGKGVEAHIVLEALAEEKPSDDTTLQAMTISYRESQQFHKVCTLYEAAVKVEPTSEELYTHLFMSYVRVGDYRSQQRAAMALYKFAPKNPYYFWAVMSIILQAKTTDDCTKKGILLTLAQRMVDNFISENKMEAEQEARLYIMILEMQEKWNDIISFIEGPLYSQLVPGSTAQASLPYLKKLGHWSRLNLHCKELLFDNQDRWDYYLPYLDSVFQLMNSNESECYNAVDDTAEKCHEFICQLVESMSSGRTLRGPYLARLELWKRLSIDGDPTALLGSGVALCIQYLRVFANKPCAVPDLKPYLAMIPQKEREEHCRDFLTCLGYDENSEPESPDDIQRHISCLCAWQLTSPLATSEEYLKTASFLRYQYLRCASRKLITATLTEFCAADGYGTLAAHFYFYAAVQQQNAAPIVDALSLLELVLHNSPSNFHAKLLLITLYHVLGNAASADSIYRCLETKHVQLLSVGWLHAARLSPGLAHARALRLLTDTHTFHKHHGKDCMEHLIYAYKYGTFEKLLELRAWGERLEACAWCALVGRELALLPLLAGPPTPLHAPTPLPDPPTDNRDLNAIVSWEPPQCEDPALRQRSFEQDVAYMRLKDGLVSCIALCIECADNRSIEEKREQLEEMQTCIEAFSSAMEKCREKYSGKQKLCISAPFPSRIIALVSSPVPYRELYSWSLRMVCFLCGGEGARARQCGVELRALLRADRLATLPPPADRLATLPPPADRLATLPPPADRLATLPPPADRLATLPPPADRLATLPPPATAWPLRDTLEAYSNYLEFIGVITFLLGVCNELTAPNNTRRSKKKANQSPDQILTSEMLSELNDDVQEIIAVLEDIFENWPLYDYEPSLEEQMSKLDVNDKYQCPVKQKLQDGLQEILTDAKNMLKKKSKYLKTLQ